MASYPTAKVKRPSRRKLGRGQHTQLPTVTITVTDSGSVAHLVFSVPVVISGNIPLVVSGGITFVSQTIIDSTHVDLTMSGALTTKTYSLAANTPQIATMQGGGNAAVSGTFP